MFCFTRRLQVLLGTNEMKVYLSLGIAASFLVFTTANAAQTARRAPARTIEKAAPSTAAHQGLRQRVEAYYRDIQENKKSDALELVAPESRNEFFRMDYHSLVSFRMEGVQLGKGGSTATVEMVRSERVPPIMQVLDLPVKDTWKRIHGQWFLVLPNASQTASPFGPMHAVGSAASGTTAQGQLPNQGPRVTPEQALAALQKVMAQQGKTLPVVALPATTSTAKKPAAQRKNNDATQHKSKSSSTPH